MIPKANQRAGGRQLATHLLNEFDNDRVELAHVRGAFARDLHGAFEEWEIAAKATLCKKFLYSLSINPDPEQRPVTRDEYYDYIARAEKALGLADQPRTVVFHVKYGREHCHVVWSRIDQQRGRAVQISHDRQKLRTVSQEFARDHGLELPAGMRANNLRDRFNNRKRQENLAEKQQEERTGITKAERMAAITKAWRATKDGKSLVAALEACGYFLARGSKDRYVVVDLFGEIHALARQIEDAKTADVKKRLQEFPVEKLPDATRAQDFARGRLDKQRAALRDHAATDKARRAELSHAHARRRAVIDDRQRTLTERHRTERAALAAAQKATDRDVLEKRLRKAPRGIMKFLARITGISLIVAQRQKRQDQARAQDHARQAEALKRRHERELNDFKRHHRALDSMQKRERRSLETQLRRDQFRAAARGSAVQVRRPPPQKLTVQQREKLEKLLANAKEITAPGKASAIDAEGLTREFNEAAERMQQEHDQDERLREMREAEEARARDDRDSGGGVRGAFNKASRGRGRDEPGTPGDRRRRQRRFRGPAWDRERR